ncbi:Putative ribosomal N-acetyltransferase YdaF [Polystyrenella longa]|uniref:Ribosomal N-acetyltransferase YdaF n=2 Tax=Polystyrenella longa TaxID=2528007 RepID=A0A518CGT8_9PLAN|nr:Putative ribosomal N-acetyltransferase YdaF [Polystyrenella longa]
MFCHFVDENIHLEPSHPYYAEPLFALTDQNREFLKKWLPWLDGVTSVDHSRDFLQQQLQNYADGTGLSLLIFYRKELAGIIGFNSINPNNQTGEIGYWLGEKFNDRGIMTKCVRELIRFGSQYYGLQKVVIRCSTGNEKSRKIPQGLGFLKEGTLRRAENLYGEWHDHDVYALLSEDFFG